MNVGFADTGISANIYDLDNNGVLSPPKHTIELNRVYDMVIEDNKNYLKLYNELKVEITKSQKLLVLTEGKTDAKHLQAAAKVLHIEDLDIRAMLKENGSLGKLTMDNGWSMFTTFLQYKLEEQGKQLIYVDRFFPSSKRCSRCGSVKKELRLDERVYRCACGNCMDRDVNAAVNIREEGRRILMTA